MISAAGILFIAPGNRALFLKRGNGSDHPLEWAFPGGKVEAGETVEAAAKRECVEEIGFLPKGARVLHTRSIAPAEIVAPAPMPGEAGAVLPAATVSPVAPSEAVDFTTFVQRVDEEFTPTLCDEHTGWAWADLTTPPEPLHPGCRVAIDRLTMDELGVARAIAAGQLTSPQRYENVSLFAMRITGTGVAYRSGRDEFVFRRPEVYLNEEFLARCNGLPVIWVHPPKASLDSKEFADRVVGTVFLPFIKGDEVWCVAKIYDDEAIAEMTANRLSTSPTVVFSDPTVNTKMRLDDGSALLIEGKPSLLDHLAICEQGVWDKGGAPAGIINDSDGETTLTEEERAAADKARKDAEDKEREDRAKADAEAGEKLDKLLKCVDAMNSRMDAMEAADKARKDAEEEEAKKKADAEAEEAKMAGDPERVAADKKRKDAEEEQARKDAEEKEREEEKAKADADIAARIARVESALPKQLSDADYAAMADAQAKADRVFQAFGDSAPRALNGEDLGAYRRRLASKLKDHSKTYKDVNVGALTDPAAFDVIEAGIYADAMAAAMTPADLPAATLRELKNRDVTGREISTFVGDPSAWMSGFTGTRRRLAGIRQA